MLKRFGEEVIMPRIREVLPGTVDDAVEKFVGAMRNNPGAGPAAIKTATPQTYAQPPAAPADNPAAKAPAGNTKTNGPGPLSRFWGWVGNQIGRASCRARVRDSE